MPGGSVRRHQTIVFAPSEQYVLEFFPSYPQVGDPSPIRISLRTRVILGVPF